MFSTFSHCLFPPCSNEQWCESFFLSLYFPGSASSPLSLTSGQPVLLDLSHCNGPQVGFAQVAVTVPSSTPKFFSIPETQQITISTAYTPVVQTVSLLTGSSSASGVNIMVAANSAANAALLSNPQVGIQVTASWMLSNVMYTTNITFPVTATESSAWSAAYQAVGYVASKNGVVSVSKSISTDGTSVTFQVGVNSTLLPSFTLSNAIFILLPSNYPTQLSACASVTTSSSPAPNNSSGSILTQLSYIQSALSLSLPSTTQLPFASTAASGIITLSVQGGLSSATFPVNANSSVVSEAVQSLTGVTPQSVTILSGQYGAYLGQRWVITFPFWMGNNVPPLTASASGVTPSSWTAGVTLTALSSSNMTGTFKLAYGNNSCSTVTIDVNVDTSYSISAKIASLASLANITAVPLSVVYNGSTSTGLQITVTFDPQTSPGFLQPLRIADATNLQGTQLSFSVNKLLNGSTNLFYMIPTEITQVPVMTPGTIRVKVNEVPSACAANSSTSCTFSFSSSLTPTITSVSPSSVISFNGSTAVPITITGTFLSATINTTVVTVGTTACNVTAVSSTQITCSLGNRVMSGVQTVNVNINPYGYASGAVNRTVQVLSITSVTPSTLSSVGWTLVNISSAGIVTSSCSSHIVTIGNQSCYVSACGDGFVSVFYPGNITSGASASAAAVSLSVLDPATSTVVDTNIWSMNVTIALPSSAPSITSLNSTPTNGAGGLVVAQLGLATLSAAVTAMLLVPTSGISVNGGANYSSLSKVFSGGYACVNATAVTNTSISCNSGPLPNGAYYLVVQYAYTSNSTTVPYTLMYVFQTISTVLTITSVSPSVGSIGGGTNLTITGSGFSTTLSQNVVLIQVPVSSTFLNGLVLCDVKSATNTSVTCVTRPCLSADATSADPNALLVQPTASAPAPVQLVICNPGLNDVNKLVCWSQARTPAATCTANSTTGCFFSYAAASTPTIQSVNPTAEQGGLPITIVGVYFTGVSQVSFFQGSKLVSNASVTFVNDTIVTAVVPALLAGAYSITLYRSNGEASVIEPKGNGSSFLSQPFLTGLVNNIGSMVGGNLLTLLSNASTNGDTIQCWEPLCKCGVLGWPPLLCSVKQCHINKLAVHPFSS
ncbi:hypothetical protein CEUSTIGMA_g8555.t1 [Chlamydomonas eustigma]|uniref:IPT/TIG domain-containing protein n=1 Tax=Chlamydomonas eustigma TaxID=1157962 RepID=A0A250XDI7_9CHLO|nr:hypothetical protein CEUSTIGMA_g8555.t1 [Chlamydomonas eustigma]|eukprot:GAX81121.1 hypothetical protein CEUSTIGMA_g8555.t1 [Chlamydomonas eustigma]